MKTVKSRHAPTIWKKLRWKSLCLPILKSITEIMKILRVCRILVEAVSKLETFVWILKHISRAIAWSLFTLKASHLVKWPTSTWSFMWWCQLNDCLEFETRPSSLLNFGRANYNWFGFVSDWLKETCKAKRKQAQVNPFGSKLKVSYVAQSCNKSSEFRFRIWLLRRLTTIWMWR